MVLKRFALPVLLNGVVSRIPSYPGSLLFAEAVNLILKDSITEDMQTMLAGRLLRLSVTDVGLHFNFLWTAGGFVAGRHVETPDLVISASARDFILLATRHEDPDTLFFGRRLVMEGDTELGVLLKNTIDALEPDIPTRIKAAPIRALAALFRGN